MSVVFDKLSFVKRLEDAGTFSRPQAETLSDAFHQAVSETVATKQDVALARSDLGHEIAQVRTDLGHEIAKVRTELGHEIAKVRTELGHEIAKVRTELGHEISQTRIDLQHETTLIRSEIKAGLAETRVWTVSVGATIIAVLAAMKYFG